MKKVILVHVYTSSPKKKKYQIIAKELSKQRVKYAIPFFPGDEHPHRDDWLGIIDKEVKNTPNPIVLVGHSLGTRAVLLYLDKFGKKVDTVILIAAFDNNYKENRKRKNAKYSGFFDYAIDVKKVKKLANKFIVVHSKDDDSIDYSQGIRISKELGAKLITYKDMSHFSGEENAVKNAKVFLEIIKSAL